MMDYLGICMVIIVTGLVVAVLAKLVTGNILDEIDRYKIRRAKRIAGIVTKGIEEGIKWTGKYVTMLKETSELEKKAKAEGTVEELNKTGFECMHNTFEEMIEESKKEEPVEKTPRKRTRKTTTE